MRFLSPPAPSTTCNWCSSTAPTASATPSAAQVHELAAIGRATRPTYTVHLLDDVRLTDAAGALIRAGTGGHGDRVDAPRAPRLRAASGGTPVTCACAHVPALARWEEQAIAPGAVGSLVETPSQLAGKLEGMPEFVTPVVERTPVARCVDVGHLWLDGHDPATVTAACGGTLRVVAPARGGRPITSRWR
ncbi:MAG: hypothetical protein H6644_19350 [Caldilineaceae bacterium]|nr:hypothetical protein [Caldilineaceae bacterium]